jgi:Yip1 domain
MDIIQRAKAITLNPAGAWPQIEAERHDAQSLFVPYMLVLAAIPAVATFIGMSLVGIGAMGMSMRMPIVNGLGLMLFSYGMTLVMTFVMGWVVSALAPTFGGQSNLVAGLKLMVFGATPVMLAGVFSILPMLGMLSLLVAVYCLYILYLGLPILMKNPKEKTVPYLLVVVVCAIVCGVILGAITSVLTPHRSAAFGKAGSVTIQTPDGQVKIDPQNMEAMAKQMQEMAAQMEKEKSK